MKPVLKALCCATLLASSTTPAMATTLEFTGVWSLDFATFPRGETAGPFSGEFGFQFDDSVVSGGFEDFLDVPVTSFSWNGDNFGGFDVDNVIAELRYIDSRLDRVLVGFSLNGASAITSRRNDFRLEYLSFTGFSSPLDAAGITKDGIDGTAGARRGEATGGNLAGSIGLTNPVPEPTTLGLLALGLAGIGRRRNLGVG